MKAQVMRDAFWDRIYELAKEDKDIVIVSADFGAPSLDKFRRDFPEQYINVGIAEQNAILVATGLALQGKKPIAYAITQFITLRCFEQIRIYPCGMNLPITIVGVGAGACYWESGSTHHCLEQLSIMRTLPNLEIINCSSQKMASQAADYAIRHRGPKFIQLDREIIHGIHKSEISFDKGYEIITSNSSNLVIATGNMVSEALKLREKTGIEFEVIDLYKIPVEKSSFIEKIKKAKQIVTMEENTREGGMGSYVLELLSDHNVCIPVSRIGLNTYEGYEPSYHYGGREEIRKAYSMGMNYVEERLRQIF